MKLVLLGDLHIGDLHPPCRTDNYLETLRGKLYQIRKLQMSMDNPVVLQAGDVFDNWKQSPYVLTKAIEYLPDAMWCIPGQHDLPQHNMKQIERSAFQTVMASEKCYFLDGLRIGDIRMEGFPWGSELKEPRECTNFNIAVMHISTWMKPYMPDQKPGHAKGLLDRATHMGWDLLVTGDNHETFVVENEDGVLINPGSLMRMRANQIKHKPCVFTFDTEVGTYEQHFLDIDRAAVTREHVEIEKAHKKRMNAFVESLKNTTEIGLSFEDNMDRFLEENEVPEPVVRELLNAMGR